MQRSQASGRSGLSSSLGVPGTAAARMPFLGRALMASRRDMMSAGKDDRLGGSSEALASGRGDTGPIKRFAEDDPGENPARHLPDADPDVARRLAGADTGSLRAQSQPDQPASSSQGRKSGTPDARRPPIYEGAT